MTTQEEFADLFSANSLIWVQGNTACRWLTDAERDALLKILCSPALSPPEPTDKREVVKLALLSLKEHELREVIETLCRVGHIDLRAMPLQDHASVAMWRPNEGQVEVMADAIDAARYAHPRHPRERPTPFAHACNDDREYAFRMARAAFAALSSPAMVAEEGTK